MTTKSKSGVATDRLNSMVRRKFGGWTLAISREGGDWVLCNHWKGHVYLEKTGVVKAGEAISFPRGTVVFYA